MRLYHLRLTDYQDTGLVWVWDTKKGFAEWIDMNTGLRSSFSQLSLEAIRMRPDKWLALADFPLNDIGL